MSIRRNLSVTLGCAIVLAAVLAVPASARVYIYPNKGQSIQQQTTDIAACKAWASSQTGYYMNVQHIAPQVQKGGEVAKGVTVGSLLGLIFAPVTGGASIAVGAVVGGAVGVGKRAQKDQVNRQSRQIVAATTAVQMADFKRAATACMNARGYTIR